MIYCRRIIDFPKSFHDNHDHTVFLWHLQTSKTPLLFLSIFSHLFLLHLLFISPLLHLLIFLLAMCSTPCCSQIHVDICGSLSPNMDIPIDVCAFFSLFSSNFVNFQLSHLYLITDMKHSFDTTF